MTDSKDINNDNQGQIKIDTIKQKGSNFTVYLDVTENEEENVRGIILHKEKSKLYRGEATRPETKDIVRDNIKKENVFNEDKIVLNVFDDRRNHIQKHGRKLTNSNLPDYETKDNVQKPLPVGMKPMLPLEYKPELRNSFVRTVMTIVLVMLIATCVIITIVMAVPELKSFFNNAGWYMILPTLLGMILICFIMNSTRYRRAAPCNYICLGFTVILQSLFAAAITTHFRTEILLYAILATTAVVFVCVLLALSKFDFTSAMMYVIAISTALLMLSLVIVIVVLATQTMMKPIILVLLVVFTMISVVSLIMDLQLVLGGKTHTLSEKDYALGAYMIYSSITDIFIKMLLMIGIGDS